MFRKTIVLFSSLVLLVSLSSFAQSKSASNGIKEWTFLVFINGNNNLDHYGALNINQMEKVGSTEKINVLVQWASLSNGKTQRLYVHQDQNFNAVTSPILEDLGQVDMGNWQSLVDFVRWGVENFPAQHYFINVWNHGSGWYRHQLLGNRNFQPLDISYDDLTGNAITTQQLGMAMAESAQIIGHKVDIYGSDACLMAMTEVADEMTSSVDISVGSEEVEPAAGWPYDTLMEKWAQKSATPEDVATILTEEYVKSYNGGTNGWRQVTFSAFDLRRIGKLNEAISKLTLAMVTLNAEARKKVLNAANIAMSFSDSSFVDLADFAKKLEQEKLEALNTDILADIYTAVSHFVIANQGTSQYKDAHGVSIWMPTWSSAMKTYGEKYRRLAFHAHTNWGSALEHLLQDQVRR